jgi:hypothetical protein
MKTHFVSFLSSRMVEFAEVMKRMNLKAKAVDSAGGFSVAEVDCTEKQAIDIWDAGFNVSEQ